MTREQVNNIANPYDGAEPGPGAPQDRPQAAGRALRSMSRGNLLLAGLFVAGTLGVYVLSLRSGPAKVSAEETTTEAQVDNALSLLGKSGPAPEDKDKAKDIVNSFYYAAKQRQIPLDRLRGNPFVFHVPRATVPATRPVEAPPAPPEEEGAKELSDAMAAVKDLRVQSILIGTRGATAIISNNLLSEGQVIQGWTVGKIQPREVLLTWKDQKYVLKMQE